MINFLDTNYLEETEEKGKNICLDHNWIEQLG